MTLVLPGEDAPWLLGSGGRGACVHAEGCWAAPACGLDGPTGSSAHAPVRPTCSCRGGGGRRAPRAASTSCRASASCSEKRPGCLQQLSVFHTRSVIAFVLRGKTKEASQHFLLLLRSSSEDRKRLIYTFSLGPQNGLNGWKLQADASTSALVHGCTSAW